MAEAEAVGAVRISVDAHGGRASGGRLLSKEGEPMDLAGFETTIKYYLTGVFNVLRLGAAAIAPQQLAHGGGSGVIVNTAFDAAYQGQIVHRPPAPRKGLRARKSPAPGR